MPKTNQALKLIMTYDMNANNMQAYYQFVMGRYIPVMQTFGFELVEAWTHAYSSDPELPNRTIAFASREGENMDKLLESDAWESINEQLSEFITNFDYKFVPYRAGFQL